MGTHWARQQVKNNELEGGLAKSILWIKANRKISAIAAGVMGLILAVSLGVYYSSRASANLAWNKLALAEGLAASGHKNQAIAQIKTLENDYPSAKAQGFGLLFAGDIYYSTGDYSAAASYYSKVADSQSPALSPLALNDLALSYEASGQLGKAVEEAQKFLNLYPDHFLAPQVHSVMARSLEGEGKKEDAKIAYQKISLEYPHTYFAAWAQNKISPTPKTDKNALSRKPAPPRKGHKKT